jgi:hypothetical protein
MLDCTYFSFFTVFSFVTVASSFFNKKGKKIQELFYIAID